MRSMPWSGRGRRDQRQRERGEGRCREEQRAAPARPAPGGRGCHVARHGRTHRPIRTAPEGQARAAARRSASRFGQRHAHVHALEVLGHGLRALGDRVLGQEAVDVGGQRRVGDRADALEQPGDAVRGEALVDGRPSSRWTKSQGARPWSRLASARAEQVRRVLAADLVGEHQVEEALDQRRVPGSRPARRGSAARPAGWPPCPTAARYSSKVASAPPSAATTRTAASNRSGSTGAGSEPGVEHGPRPLARRRGRRRWCRAPRTARPAAPRCGRPRRPRGSPPGAGARAGEGADEGLRGRSRSSSGDDAVERGERAERSAATPTGRSRRRTRGARSRNSADAGRCRPAPRPRRRRPGRSARAG